MKVLVADDRPTTRFSLKKKLTQWGYEVIDVVDGDAAWEELCRTPPPRIAILDWMMPAMDGVTICKKLKERQEGPFIYTILLTSKNGKEDLVYALENGAHNFQSKPITPEELRSHVNVGKRLVETEDKLKEYATQMEILAEKRARQLVHADRLATLGSLLAGITHEISSPLTYIAGRTQIIEIHWTELEEKIRALIEKSGEDCDSLLEKLHLIPDAFQDILQGTERINTIVKGMKSFSRKDTGKRRLTRIHDCIENALKLCNNALKYHVVVEKDFDENVPGLMINSQQIEQVLVNLFTNAADAMYPMGKGILRVATTKKPDHVLVEVMDNGPGIKEDLIQNIWEPFYTTKPVGKGTGLGLSISRGIIEDHGGEIYSRNLADTGAVFGFTLPVPESKRKLANHS